MLIAVLIYELNRCHFGQRDGGFLPLCASIGLTDYWRGRGVKPDYMKRQP